jgi:hypothetical protein
MIPLSVAQMFAQNKPPRHPFDYTAEAPRTQRSLR